MEKSVKVSAKNIQYKYFWGKIQRIKTALGAKCNGKKLVVLAKNKQHKKNTKKNGIWGKIQWRKAQRIRQRTYNKNTFRAKYNGSRRRWGRNTMEKS
jgi:hypothetical protein